MNNKQKISAIGVILLSAMSTSLHLSAQDSEGEHHRPKHHQYKLIDLGTFGGPNGLVNGPGIPILSDRGTYAGAAETSIPDPYAPNCRDRDCLVEHAQRWRHGIVADLGTLPGTNLSSEATWVSPRGRIVGFSQNGLIDPLLGIPEIRAVRWTRNGRIIDLGTLEGGHESFATIVNDRGLVGGFSTNTIADPFSMEGLGYQTRGFLSEDGVLQDIGTLGGPDTLPLSINERGQISGNSYTTSSPNSTTGIPTIDPFFWEDGTMVDVGTLGGTIGFANFLNSRGEVVGYSNLAGDLTHHPFLWSRGELKDLGTLGGHNGEAFWINDAGDVVGWANNSVACPGCAEPGDQEYHAVLWKEGRMRDLRFVKGDRCSVAFAVNGPGQVVGASGICHGSLHAFLWENGGPMVNVNTLVFPRSDINAIYPFDINDRGEIAAQGILPNGDIHAVLLIPYGDCDDECEARIAANENSAAISAHPAMTQHGVETPANKADQVRNPLAGRYHVPGRAVAPSN